jgi:hypothetical protein
LRGTNSSISIVRVDSSATEFVLGHFEVTVAIDLIAFDDVLGRDLFAGICIHLQIPDAVTGLLIDLIETDFLGFGRRRKKSYRTGHQR